MIKFIEFLEMMGSVGSIVSCKDLDNPKFQVQGALSNLNCKNKKKNKILKMKFNNENSINPIKFNEWVKLLEAKNSKTKKGKKVPGKYLSGLKEKGKYGSKEAMKKEIEQFRGKDNYKLNWDADYKNGKRIKTKKGKATKAFEKMFGGNKK